MLCQTCQDIDMRFLKESVSEAIIKDPGNVVFAELQSRRRDAKFIQKIRQHGFSKRVIEAEKEKIQEWEETGNPHCLYYLHHSSANILLVSALAGCYICNLIRYGFSRDSSLTYGQITQDFSKPVILVMHRYTDGRHWTDAPPGEWLHVHCGHLRCSLEIARTPSEELDEFPWEFASAISKGSTSILRSTWSSLNVRLARKWHEICKEKHGRCRIESKQLPTRLIDLGRDASFQPVLIQPQPDSSEEYVILSHCWGDNKPLKYHQDTSCPNQWLLPLLPHWPQTFQDAVCVTRAFNIRYLWIDSLCILRDIQHQADWEVESVKMAQYFRNAAFTIAANDASSGSEGLFRQRDCRNTHICPLGKFDCKTSGGKKTIYVCLADFTMRRPKLHREKTYNLDHLPLSRRGWVLQEELLSPRSLEFGRKSLHWRCFCAKWSESDLGAGSGEDEAGDYMELRGFQDKWESPYQLRRNTRYDQWYHIIDMLNRRNITYQGDILPAISGIAVIVVHHLKSDDKYLAGLWKNDLSVGLLWCAGNAHNSRPSLGPSIRNFDQTEFFAPSWSWVSMAHKRVLIGLHDLLLPSGGGSLRFEGCTTLYISSNISPSNESAPYGRVNQGILSFRAQCPRVTVLLNSSADKDIDSEVEKLEFPPRPQSCRLEYKRMETVDEIPTCFGDSLLPTGDCLLDDEQTLISREPDRGDAARISGIFLPLLLHGHDGHVGLRLMGLVLVPANAAKHQSQRLASPLGTVSGSPERRPDLADADSEEPKPFYYRRIGRGALNIPDGLLDWATSGLPFGEINIC